MSKQTFELNIFSRVSFLDKMLFTKHLSVMIKSGIPIAEALDVLYQQTSSPQLKKILNRVLKQVQNGEPLSRALASYPHVFNTFYRSIIEIGEESGELEDNLTFLAKQLAKDYSLKKKIQGAMLYPGIVLSASLIIGFGLSVFVLPKLIDLFNSLEVNLPLTTKILLFLAYTMRDYGVFIGIGTVILIILFKLLIQLQSVKPVWDRVLLSFPIIGQFLQYGEVSALFRNLGIMIKSGMTITKSLEIQKEITTNEVFRRYISRIQKSVDRGKDIKDELENGTFSKIPPLAIKMIGVGEKTGKLDETFLYLGDFYEEEIDDAAKNLTTVLEPILLMGIGLIVAFVAFAIISPIYELTGSIKR